jgi:hypothetical protein
LKPASEESGAEEAMIGQHPISQVVVSKKAGNYGNEYQSYSSKRFSELF